MLFRTLNPDDEFPRPSPNFIMSFYSAKDDAFDSSKIQESFHVHVMNT